MWLMSCWNVSHVIMSDWRHDRPTLLEINLFLIRPRPFNELANGASHMQIDVAVSQIQRLEYSALLCTEIVVLLYKRNRLHLFRHFSGLPSKHLDDQLLYCWKLLIWQLCSRVSSWKRKIRFTFLTRQMRVGEQTNVNLMNKNNDS